mgnify:CR=1 FL=1
MEMWQVLLQASKPQNTNAEIEEIKEKNVLLVTSKYSLWSEKMQLFLNDKKLNVKIWYQKLKKWQPYSSKWKMNDDALEGAKTPFPHFMTLTEIRPWNMKKFPLFKYEERLNIFCEIM